MKKNLWIIILIFWSIHVMGQINLTGQSKYVVDITGYMGRGNDGCGDIDGLRNVNLIKNDGSSVNLYEGRLLHSSFNYNAEFTKSNPANKVIFHKIIRWKNWLGNCDG